MKQWILAKLQERKERKRFEKLVPWYYRERCEVFGMCRDELNNFKCRHGCLERQYDEKRKK